MVSAFVRQVWSEQYLLSNVEFFLKLYAQKMTGRDILFIVSCDSLVRVASGAVNVSVRFGYVCLHLGTDAQCCDDSGDSESNKVT